MPEFTDKTLVIIVAIPPSNFSLIAADFVRNLSILVHAVVKIKKHLNGSDMIYPWTSEVPSVGRSKRDLNHMISRVRREVPTKVIQG